MTAKWHDRSKTKSKRRISAHRLSYFRFKIWSNAFKTIEPQSFHKDGPKDCHFLLIYAPDTVLIKEHPRHFIPQHIVLPISWYLVFETNSALREILQRPSNCPLCIILNVSFCTQLVIFRAQNQLTCGIEGDVLVIHHCVPLIHGAQDPLVSTPKTILRAYFVPESTTPRLPLPSLAFPWSASLAPPQLPCFFLLPIDDL